MKLTSSAFENFGTIPKLYTCDGKDISVPLSWSGAPKGTGWLAVTVIDPGGPVTHWYVIDIPAATTGIKQGASFPNSTPGKQVSAWLGMCPEGGPGIPDTYEFTVYAMPSSYKPPKRRTPARTWIRTSSPPAQPTSRPTRSASDN